MKTINEYVFDKTISSIDEYVSHNETISLIKEYLLSKSKKHIVCKPEKGCTIDDIVKWIKSYGIAEAKKFSVDPKKGEIIYAVGPDLSNPNYAWVALRTKPIERTQSIVAKPGGQSFYTSGDPNNPGEKTIEFEDAIDKRDNICSWA